MQRFPSCMTQAFTSALLYAALLAALGSLIAGHQGPPRRNPGVWLTTYAALLLPLSLLGVFEVRNGFTLAFPAVLLALVWCGAALGVGRVQPDRVGLRGLIGISLARIPVEWMLHRLYEEGSVPEAMTWSGTNLDILSGLGAFILFLYTFREKFPYTALRVWNILGLLLLANVVGTAVLSIPTRFQQLNFDHPNLAVTQYPFVLLPAVIVPAVLYSHLRLLGLGKKG